MGDQNQVSVTYHELPLDVAPGSRILLDDGEPHKCVQLISCSGVYCNYFKNAVLPADKELYRQIRNYNKKGEMQNEEI